MHRDEMKSCLVLLALAVGCTPVPPGPAKSSATAPANGPRQVAAPPTTSDAPRASTAAPRMTIQPWNPTGSTRAVVVADAMIERGDGNEALEILANLDTPAACLLKARAQRSLGQLTEAKEQLKEAAKDRTLRGLVSLEQGFLAGMAGDDQAATTYLLEAMKEGPAVAQRAVLPLLESMLQRDPAGLLAKAPAWESVLPKDDADARTIWLEAQARAHETLGHADDAKRIRLQRFLEEPISQLTPPRPPDGTTPTREQLLARAEMLVEAHRSERAIDALSTIDETKLDELGRCRWELAMGVSSRKLRRYGPARGHLQFVVSTCKDEEMVRSAMYLLAKVISIKQGLEAIPVIEDFATRFSGNSMVDDVLFWAGDLHQRRKQWVKAADFFNRVQAVEPRDDHCSEARWRLAWMAFEQRRWEDARTALAKVLVDDGCSATSFDRTRALYWRARTFLEEAKRTEAITELESLSKLDPLGTYGQLALAQLARLDPARATEIAPASPKEDGPRPNLCLGPLARDPAFQRALELLARGLHSDAAAVLESIPVSPEAESAARQHLAAGETTLLKATDAAECAPEEWQLLLALMLDRAGAHRDAHWRLRTTFADLFTRPPTDAMASVWRAAYPLAYRDRIEFAERESGLPDLLLQALAREESALDPQVVSWAGAYGLTQLLLSSARGAGRLLDPPVTVATAEDLLEPGLNARLGGALLGSLLRRFHNNPALALAAYNAGENAALTWARRHSGDPFDVFAEEITIKETRGYVLRVLTTFGIYRWLYLNEAPRLPVPEQIPDLRH